MQAYAFQASPAAPGLLDRMRETMPYYADNVTMVAEDEGVGTAEATAIPMRQNVRGTVHAMAGVAGVASQPLVRRRGHVRAVVTELLRHRHDSGDVVSALYPFRPSFYERFGYVGVPRTRTVRFSPADLGRLLLTAELDGSVSMEPIADGYDGYREFTRTLLTQRHGMALLPDRQDGQLREGRKWLVTARVDGAVVGALTYRINGFGGELVTGDLLVTSALGRALILQFLARHTDQVSTVVLTVPADEQPELWATDFAAVTETRTAFPLSPAPMVRVLSLDGLAGTRVGAGRVSVEIVDDPLLTGGYLLDGRGGELEVTRHTGTTDATLTVAGLSALVYGVLRPDEVVVRGFGAIPATAATELAALFPPALPYLYAQF